MYIKCTVHQGQQCGDPHYWEDSQQAQGVSRKGSCSHGTK